VETMEMKVEIAKSEAEILKIINEIGK